VPRNQFGEGSASGREHYFSNGGRSAHPQSVRAAVGNFNETFVSKGVGETACSRETSEGHSIDHRMEANVKSFYSASTTSQIAEPWKETVTIQV
jgi:hypothetical protein